jgi:hypothetical protein
VVAVSSSPGFRSRYSVVVKIRKRNAQEAQEIREIRKIAGHFLGCGSSLILPMHYLLARKAN